MNTELPIWSQENTAAAFDDPQIGDHFMEMATFHVFVVDRNATGIMWAAGSAPISFPGEAKFTSGTLEEFRTAFRYPTSKNYWVRLAARGVNVQGWTPPELINNESATDKTEQLVQVYIVSNPGWAQNMVLRTVDNVLENMRTEIEEMSDFTEFSVRIEQWKQCHLDGLEEFYG